MTENRSDAHWLTNSEGSTPASTPLISEFLDTVSGGRFIDVGCGFGRGTFELARKGAEVVGVDLNKRELEEGIRRREEIGHEKVVFIQARGDALPFADSTFDGGIMLGLLGGIVGENARNVRQRIISDTARTLRPGSPLYVAEFAVVTDPAAVDFYGKPWQQVYEDERKITGERGSFTVRQPDGSTHFLAHHFTRNELTHDFEKVGIHGLQVREFMGKSALSGNLSPQIVIWGKKK